MNDLKITIIQPDIIWENAENNLEKFSEMVSKVKSTNIIVFPETFNTGFSMNTEACGEKMDGKAVRWMKEVAVEKNASVTGSLVIEEDGKYYNRAVWVFPDKSIEFYDKRHLFSMGEEDKHFSKGKRKVIIEYMGWRICPLICYDLRFPVWSRNLDDYDILIYMVNWPEVRQHVWKNLLVARAIENQSYCIGANRIGRDGNDISYFGESALITAEGYATFLDSKEQIKTFVLSLPKLHDFRNKFPVLKDKDPFNISN